MLIMRFIRLDRQATRAFSSSDTSRTAHGFVGALDEASGDRRQGLVSSLHGRPEPREGFIPLAGDVIEPAPSFLQSRGLESFTCHALTFNYLEDVGTFDVNEPKEIRDNGNASTAFGVNGFNPPSLLSVNYHKPYLHRGQAQTLADVFPLHGLGAGTTCLPDAARGEIQRVHPVGVTLVTVMRQLTFVEAGRVEWREVPDAVLPGPSGAVVRPPAVARCDLDLPMATAGLFPGPFPVGHKTRLFHRFNGIERELPIHYDLVVDTDVLDREDAADIVASAGRRRA
jgi:hypothetical protein